VSPCMLLPAVYPRLRGLVYVFECVHAFVVLVIMFVGVRVYHVPITMCVRAVGLKAADGILPVTSWQMGRQWDEGISCSIATRY